MKITPKDIIEIFSYTQEEQETFEYIRRYMKRISPVFELIEKDEVKLKRFALIGLFLGYRACNHVGETFSTEIETDDSDNLYAKRLIAIKQYFGVSINDSEDYLSLINISFISFFFYMLGIFDLSKKFYKFVLK